MISKPTVRPSRVSDAPGVSAMLQALVAAGKRSRPADEGFVRSAYIGPGLVSSFVAEAEGAILGIQLVGIAGPDNDFGVAEGDGYIGTHVHPDAAGQGIGRALLAQTRQAARAANLRRIVAAIGRENAEGLGYYAAMGFVQEREGEGRIYRVLTL